MKLRTVWWRALPFLMAACADAPVAGPSIESVPQALTADQAAYCQRLELTGQPTPWWCGRREADLAPPLDDACPDRQWIGYRLEGGICPSAPSGNGTWQVSEPFAQSRDARLRRLCQYTWESTNPRLPEPDVAALPDVRSLRLERDCEVVAPHAVPQPVADELFGAWSTQAEVPDWSAAQAFAAPRIRVAVVDGGQGPETPTGAAPDMVDHAVMVSSIVRAIACPARGGSALCVAGVPNYAAMPYVAPGILGELGGYFGTQAGFADALAAAVDAWINEPLATRPARLIVNLSLGWDADFDISTVQRIPAAAALWAAQYATCEGALLIAAAGNRAADSDSGPLFPGGWEVLPRACGGAPVGVYSPLVHAVGAVDGRDAPLAISRLGANPRLVAPGALVVVPEDTSLLENQPSIVLSGTSIAAASVSGAAALVWSMRPGLHPDQVMDVIYRSGVPLGVSAEFGLNNQLAGRRRLSVSRAFARACPQNFAFGACPAPASRPVLAPTRAAGINGQADFAAIAELLFTDPIDLIEDPAPVEPTEPSAFYLPSVVPQPGEPNCPICGFVGTTLQGALSNNLDGATLGDAKVRISDINGNPHTISVSGLSYGVNFKIDLTAKLVGITIKTAYLEIPAVIGGKAVLTSSELFVN